MGRHKKVTSVVDAGSEPGAVAENQPEGTLAGIQPNPPEDRKSRKVNKLKTLDGLMEEFKVKKAKLVDKYVNKMLALMKQ